jgi:SAM-dependent methyltransferase
MICRICDATDLAPVIDLGRQPWCNHFLSAAQVGTEPLYPLRVVHCARCKTAQLDFTVPKEVMFGDHTYLSGTTRALSAHFAAVAQEVDARFCAGRAYKSVLDIGSNDGTQLRHYQKLGFDTLGVESSRTTARIANEAGVPTLNAFFNLGTLRGIGRRFDVVNASGVFFHLEELHSVCEAIREAMRPDGVFVVQFLYMRSIIENMAFDQIYHEHLLYYTLESIETLLARHGLTMFDARLSPIHGGSIVGYVGHAGAQTSPRLAAMRAAEAASGCNTADAYRAFGSRIAAMKVENLAFLASRRAAGRRIFGMGAPVKGNTLLNYFGVGPGIIECLVERNELRRGLYSPGMHIPIVIESEMTEQPDVYYVLAWNFKKEILARYRNLIAQGIEFHFPVNPVEFE